MYFSKKSPFPPPIKQDQLQQWGGLIGELDQQQRHPLEHSDYQQQLSKQFNPMFQDPLATLTNFPQQHRKQGNGQHLQNLLQQPQQSVQGKGVQQNTQSTPIQNDSVPNVMSGAGSRGGKGRSTKGGSRVKKSKLDNNPQSSAASQQKSNKKLGFQPVQKQQVVDLRQCLSVYQREQGQSLSWISSCFKRSRSIEQDLKDQAIDRYESTKRMCNEVMEADVSCGEVLEKINFSYEEMGETLRQFEQKYGELIKEHQERQNGEVVQQNSPRQEKDLLQKLFEVDQNDAAADVDDVGGTILEQILQEL
eukprot:TRINITY_DN20361_c0_g1_i2.p1 TRINITY_DN20361_c0_g1~~TRINITY_DN20361_c0_g1_i2.p1  ORF type:complete len:306 (+),score=39.54 TRINITY_DN20361_c0_g1_i2:108-1025(+)